ncbi:hypothetical protein E0H73_35800 [Kribbella pittospori]|uniref:Uncharacterized protein n=1 Tax=Kribbella pittospori TaxID=722689 RepID=A0A4R0K7R9_9ACTN|nr:hypothetical protein [Kribbella pittospori]TCC55297.1 hypothetical protein E0H73_35800 [Kribbella pittospori]
MHDGLPVLVPSSSAPFRRGCGIEQQPPVAPRWRLEPDGVGCLVTHVYDWREFTHLDMIDELPVVGADGLQESLDRLAAAICG